MFDESDALKSNTKIPDRPRRPKPKALPTVPPTEWLGSEYKETVQPKDVRSVVDKSVRLGFLAITILALGGAAYNIVTTLIGIYT